MLMNIFAWIFFAIFAAVTIFAIWLENSGESDKPQPEDRSGDESETRPVNAKRKSKKKNGKK